MLPYGIDIKTAGSQPVSLPTMLVAFARYSCDSCFVVLRNNIRFLVVLEVSIRCKREVRADVCRSQAQRSKAKVSTQ